jgi:RHS repeat-associated protein
LTDGASSFSYGTHTNEGEIQPGTSSAVSYNAGAELTSSTSAGTTTSFGYDANGERCWSSTTSTSGSCGAPPSGANTYTWNAFHQLTASNYGSTTATYAYSGDGLRTSDSIGSATNSFAWDQVTTPSQPLLLEDSSEAYVYGATTTPIEQIALPSQTSDFIASDPGGVRYVFSAVWGIHSLLEASTYSTFGVPSITGISLSQFGFQGGYTDSDGLVYLVNRYYDPATDQFLSVDPDVAETGEPYAFTGNDPLNVTDPLGLRGWYCIGGRTYFYRGNKYGAVGNGTCAQVYEEEALASFDLRLGRILIAINLAQQILANEEAQRAAESAVIKKYIQATENLQITCGVDPAQSQCGGALGGGGSLRQVYARTGQKYTCLSAAGTLIREGTLTGFGLGSGGGLVAGMEVFGIADAPESLGTSLAFTGSGVIIASLLGGLGTAIVC